MVDKLSSPKKWYMLNKGERVTVERRRLILSWAKMDKILFKLKGKRWWLTVLREKTLTVR